MSEQTSDQPTLVIINGPPASGKTTLARLLCAQMHLALHLDVDEIRDMVSNWEADKQASGLFARCLARSMATCHLSNRRSVVVSQLFGRHDDLDQLNELAQRCQANYIEVVIRVPRDTALERFVERGGPKFDTLRGDRPDSIVSEFDVLFNRIALDTSLRDGVVTIDSLEGDVPGTLKTLVEAIEIESA